MSMSIHDLGLVDRTINALLASEITTYEQLAQMTDSELLAIPNLGRKAFNEIKDAMVKKNSVGSTMKSLFAALVKAQAEIGAAIKDSTNPHFRSKYADLASVVAAIKPVAAKYGIGYVQRFSDAQNGVAVETVIIHESGEQLPTGVLFVPASKQDAQGYGSAITYARRYSLQTAFGVPADDDDGNAAAASAPKISPVKESLAELSDESQAHVANVADGILEALASGDDKTVFELAESLDSDQRVYLWSMWAEDSKIRSRVKKIVSTFRQIAGQAAPEKVAA